MIVARHGVILVTAVALGSTACNYDIAEFRMPPVVEITSTETTVGYLQEIQLSARALDGSGNLLARSVVTWSSADEDVARVTTDGAVTGVWPGTTILYAQAAGAVDSVRVVVHTRGRRCGRAPVRVPGHAFDSMRIAGGWMENHLQSGEIFETWGTKTVSAAAIVYGTTPENTRQGTNNIGVAQDFYTSSVCDVPGGPGTHTVALLQGGGVYYGQRPIVENLTLVQEQFAFASPADAAYLLFRYSFTNEGAVPIEDMRLGVATDFDVVDYPFNVGTYDPATGVAAVMWRDSIHNWQVTGMQFVDVMPASYVTTFGPSIAWNTEMFRYMSSGIGPTRTPVEDVKQLMAVPAFDIAPGETVSRWFVIATGVGRDQFNTSLARAAATARALEGLPR